LRRLAFPHGAAHTRQAVTENAAMAADALDRMVFDVVHDQLQGRPLVLVPTGSLHLVPWAALPSLRGRAVSVSPSAAVWAARAVQPSRRRGRVAIVAGPDLAGAAGEAHAIAGLRPDARVFVGSEARAATVARALDGASIAHIAAHGRFRRDHPSFSALQLDDGPLTVYDLEQLRRVPELVILSACDVGRSGVHAGDELIGFVASLLGLGTRALIASVVPVADEPARDVMVALHQRLCEGDTPAWALAATQGEAFASGDPSLAAAASSFVCYGAG
jgi:CHAT domain-containing protein